MDTLRKERINKAKAKRDAWKARKAAKTREVPTSPQGGNAVDDDDAAAADRASSRTAPTAIPWSSS